MTPEIRVAALLGRVDISMRSDSESTPQSTEALAKLRVLDISDSVAGQYCTRLMADFGADVTLVEPPDGSPIRRALPLDPRDSRSSLLFFHLNMGKRSLVLPVDDRRDALAVLVASADVVVVGPHVDHSWMKEANPRCVVALVSPFGTDGPYQDWKGSEMIYQALSGMMFHNGTEGREPLYGCGQRASYAAGVAAYITVLAALLARERIGVGQEVAVDIVETGASMCYPAATQYFMNGSIEGRGDRRQPLGYVQCSDAWVAFWIQPHRWTAGCHAINASDLLTDPRFALAPVRQDNWAVLVAEIQSRVATWCADDLVSRWQAARLVAARAYDLPSLLSECEHLRARGYWERLNTLDGLRVIPGPPFRMSATPRKVRAGAPQLGEDPSATQKVAHV
jgi:crotonobetainyl-CoA:carnitine CoA-transferase CaiB-like acyl-CoA transferase